MNHQPFENWLLSDGTLSPEDTQALAGHLETCDYCRELQTAWMGVVGLFENVPEVEPLPGFVNRWQGRLAIELEIETSVRHRWQSMIMLILIGNVVAGLVFLLGSAFFTTFDTPLSWLLSGVYRVVSLVTYFNTIQNIFLTLFRTITSIVPVGYWALIGIGLVGAGATWIISMTSLSVLPWRTRS